MPVLDLEGDAPTIDATVSHPSAAAGDAVPHGAIGGHSTLPLPLAPQVPESSEVKSSGPPYAAAGVAVPSGAIGGRLSSPPPLAPRVLESSGMRPSGRPYEVKTSNRWNSRSWATTSGTPLPLHDGTAPARSLSRESVLPLHSTIDKSFHPPPGAGCTVLPWSTEKIRKFIDENVGTDLPASRSNDSSSWSVPPVAKDSSRTISRSIGYAGSSDDHVHLIDEENTALVDGVWQSDGSRHCAEGQVKGGDVSGGTLIVPARSGHRTLKVAYFFSGIKRKASIGNSLRKLCESSGTGLIVHEVDILVGGSEHDLMDPSSQDDWMSRVEAGEFDVCIYSPPCGSWSRANWANDDGPQPCRNRAHPWGIPHQRAKQKERADNGNRFVHFAIRGIEAAARSKLAGRDVFSLLEHPEDLGRTHRGQPASIWQLPELRKAFGNSQCWTVAGHQCQFPGVDRAKPTRLFSDLVGVHEFGRCGWPTFDAADYYQGPLPRSCGHQHNQKMIGRLSGGGFATAPTAAYPEGMCDFIANLVFNAFRNSKFTESPVGVGEASLRSVIKPTGTTSTSSSSSSSLPAPTSPSTTGAACGWDGPLRRWQASGGNTLMSAESIQTQTLALEEIGTGRPIKDELELGAYAPVSHPIAGDVTTDEETELPGTARPPKRSGWWGRGPPLRPHRKGVPRDFVDGGGLCSPGRWEIDKRVLPDNHLHRRIRKTLFDGLLKAEKHHQRGNENFDLKKLLMVISVGKLKSSPFPEEIVQEVRDNLCVLLREAGHGDGLPQSGDAAQMIEVRLIQSLLEAFGDPDAYFCQWWATGVWLGSTRRKLPRTPAVFDRKVKWRLAEPPEESHGEWQLNYSSMQDHADLVHEQFCKEEKLGMMTTLTLRQAMAEYGEDLNIAATAAIEKKGRTDEVRVLYDGTNGLDLNECIRVRDQVRYPTASDAKVVVGAMADEGGPHFSLKYDVLKAHRQCPVLREDWGRQACQIRGSAATSARNFLRKAAEAAEKVRSTTGKVSDRKARLKPRIEDLPDDVLDELIWLNTVGTFGVGSAGYWWGRAGAAIMRLTHYALGYSHAIWALLYSDDGWLVGRTERFEVGLLLHLFVLLVVGVPLSWHKVSGGIQCDWIGYYLDVGRFEVGVSATRAAWAVRWLEDKARERRVQLGELREGLGRLQFLAGPLEHLRPFLGPLYAWSCAGPRYLRPLLPVMVLIILRYLASELKRERMTRCTTKARDVGEFFRLDAKAEGEEVAIGGWRSCGGSRTREAPWFAVRLNRRNAPWAFARGEAFRTVASLELLGALVGLMVLCPSFPSADAVGTATLSCGTDNQGNSFLLDKCLTTKYPLGVVLMEVACQAALKGAVLRARWLPRLQNEEADALTNSDFSHFDPALRIDVDLETLPFVVMPALFAEGDAYVAELSELKAAEAKRIAGGGERYPGKRRKKDKLADRDPWA